MLIPNAESVVPTPSTASPPNSMGSWPVRAFSCSRKLCSWMHRHSNPAMCRRSIQLSRSGSVRVANHRPRSSPSNTAQWHKTALTKVGKSFPSHKALKVALNSTSLAFSQTLAYTARLQIQAGALQGHAAVCLFLLPVNVILIACLTLSTPKVTGADESILKPTLDPPLKKIVSRTVVPGGVGASKTWSLVIARVKISGRSTPWGSKYGFPKKAIWIGTTLNQNWAKVHPFFKRRQEKLR